MGMARGCPAPWHKQAPGNHSHLHKYSLNMRDEREAHIQTMRYRPSHRLPALQLKDSTVILSFDDKLTPPKRSRSRNNNKAKKTFEG